HAARPGVHGTGRPDARAGAAGRRRSAGGQFHTVLRRATVKCPYCGHLGDKVVDSRESKEGDAIRRRRECLECGRRFTSYERIDEIPYMVVKKDGRRERFDRQKLVEGLLKACEKRPVRVAALEAIADRIEAALQERPEREMATQEIGQLVMDELKTLDKVAFVRFASVYRNFRGIDEFTHELNALLRTREKAVPAILIVDDEAGVRASLGDALREAGYHVDTVDSAEACLDQAGRRSYDLILLDIRLPGVDGLTALERLVARAVDATVVMMSGH